MTIHSDGRVTISAEMAAALGRIVMQCAEDELQAKGLSEGEISIAYGFADELTPKDE